LLEVFPMSNRNPTVPPVSPQSQAFVKLDSGATVLLIRDALLRQEFRWADIPKAGRAMRLDKYTILYAGSGTTARLVQGEWVGIPPEKIPIDRWLKALRAVLELKATALEAKLDRLDSLLGAIEAGDLEQVIALLGQTSNRNR
jgi:hypothetical protein